MAYDVRNFEEEVIRRSFEIPVLVDFWADWCGPCKMLGPILERLAAGADGRWALAKLDTELFPDIAARYGLRGIPNVKLFVDGRVSAEFTGALPEAAVRRWLDAQLPSRFHRAIDQAEALLRSGMMREARILLEPAVEAEPDNQRARVLLAQVLLESDHRKALELVEGIEEDSRYHLMAESVRTFNALLEKGDDPGRLPESPVRRAYLEGIEAVKKREFALALERFIQVIREDRYYDEDGARKACIAIFKYLGEEHETTMNYRREFSSALY